MKLIRLIDISYFERIKEEFNITQFELRLLSVAKDINSIKSLCNSLGLRVQTTRGIYINRLANKGFLKKVRRPKQIKGFRYEASFYKKGERLKEIEIRLKEMVEEGNTVDNSLPGLE